MKTNMKVFALFLFSFMNCRACCHPPSTPAPPPTPACRVPCNFEGGCPPSYPSTCQKGCCIQNSGSAL